ncbi:MAG TPA: hypothetical protein VI299_27225 [Polyangiales bacterium]
MAVREGGVEAERVRTRKGAVKGSYKLALPGTKVEGARPRRREQHRVELTCEAGSVLATARVVARRGHGADTGRMQLELPRNAPPGIYRGTVPALDGEIPVSMVVPVRQQLQVEPAHVVREIDRDGTERAELMLTNTGNVPLEIQHPSAVILEPRDRSCRVLRGALGLIDEDKALGPLDALVRAAAESTRADTALATRIEGAPFTLAPGETRCATLTMRVRAPSRGVYRARIAIAGARVRIEVHAHHSDRGES